MSSKTNATYSVKMQGTTEPLMHQMTIQLLGSVVWISVYACVCVCVCVFAVMDSRGFAINSSVISFNNNLKYFLVLAFQRLLCLIRNQDIVVIKEIVLWAEPSGVPILLGTNDFSLLQNVQTSSGPIQSLIAWVLGFFLGCKVVRARG